MADSSRVEELRKRYHENPRRFFAPLANEYRKGGFLDRAILLCQKHLGEQPGNMNGLIVYGQTLFESGRHEDARAPFESALELDPENLIALRQLGDIARLGGDQDGARKWYSRVLEYDRRNEEVRELLTQVGGPASASTVEVTPRRATPPAAMPAMPAMPASAELASRPSTSPRTLEITPRRVPTPAHAATPPRAATPARGQRRASLLDIDFDFGELAGAEPKAAPAPAAPLLGAEAAEYGFAASDLPLLDLIADAPAEALVPVESLLPVESPISLAPASESLIELPPEPAALGDIPRIAGIEMAEFDTDVEALPDLESSEFSAGDVGIAPLPELETAEFQVPSADATPSTLPDLEVTGLDEHEFEIETAFPNEAAIESASAEPAILTPSSVQAIDSDPFGLPTPASQPAIVTETMAELYLEQGHRAEAIEVYRKLIALDPSDRALRDRLAALEAPKPALLASELLAPDLLAPDLLAPELLEPEFEMDDEDAAIAELEFIDTSTPISVPRVPAPVAPVAAMPPAAALAPLVGLEMLDDLDVPDVAAAQDAPRISMEFDLPADAEQHVPERAPANAMLAEVSFADLELSTPEPAAPEAEVAGGPTAREFFASFAERTLSAPRVPVAAVAAVSAPSSGGWAIPPAISSLDDLFGGEVTDEDQRAANYLAGVGTTSAPSGTSSFDALFASSEPSHTPARNAVPRASEKLKFDQFFSATSSGASPTVPAPAPEPTSAPGAAPGDDDLDQFQGWLKGLTQ